MERRSLGAKKSHLTGLREKKETIAAIDELIEDGGLAPLVPLLRKCTAHNTCVFSLCGASLLSSMREDLLMLLQYTDFLFILRGVSSTGDYHHR